MGELIGTVEYWKDGLAKAKMSPINLNIVPWRNRPSDYTKIGLESESTFVLVMGVGGTNSDLYLFSFSSGNFAVEKINKTTTEKIRVYKSNDLSLYIQKPFGGPTDCIIQTAGGINHISEVTYDVSNLTKIEVL